MTRGDNALFPMVGKTAPRGACCQSPSLRWLWGGGWLRRGRSLVITTARTCPVLLDCPSFPRMVAYWWYTTRNSGRRERRPLFHAATLLIAK